MDKDELSREREDTDGSPENYQGVSTARKVVECLIILAVLVFISGGIILPQLYSNYLRKHGKQHYCSPTEQDAKNVLAALASYFSEPENMRVPTVEVLISDADLYLNNPVENVILFPEPGESAQSQTIRVMVIDDTHCPRNNAYIATMGGGIGYWE